MNKAKMKAYRNRAVGAAAVVGGVTIAVLVHKNKSLKISVKELGAVNDYLKKEMEISDKVAWDYHDLFYATLGHFKAKHEDIRAIAAELSIPLPKSA